MTDCDGESESIHGDIEGDTYTDYRRCLVCGTEFAVKYKKVSVEIIHRP